MYNILYNVMVGSTFSFTNLYHLLDLYHFWTPAFNPITPVFTLGQHEIEQYYRYNYRIAKIIIEYTEYNSSSIYRILLPKYSIVTIEVVPVSNIRCKNTRETYGVFPQLLLMWYCSFFFYHNLLTSKYLRSYEAGID